MWLFYLLFIIVVLAGAVYFWQNIRPEINTRRNLALLSEEAPTLTQDGITFRDLNKNGKLDPFEDPRRPIEERVEDLLGQMTLEEKAGMMFHTMIGIKWSSSCARAGSVRNGSTSRYAGFCGISSGWACSMILMSTWRPRRGSSEAQNSEG